MTKSSARSSCTNWDTTTYTPTANPTTSSTTTTIRKRNNNNNSNNIEKPCARMRASIYLWDTATTPRKVVGDTREFDVRLS